MSNRQALLRRTLLAAALAAASGTSAFAHVTLPPGGASAGSLYEAAFRVGHACRGAQRTTGLTVRLPDGFALVDVQPRPGWTVQAPQAGSQEVRWTVQRPEAGLPTGERADFVLRGKLPAQPGPLYFKVLQICDVGQSDWSQLPAADPGAKLEFPAARLDVLPPGVAPLDVKDAWVRQTVPGQSGTGAFMKLTAPSGGRLVSASTPVAKIAEVHEMRMEGDTMRMRELSGGLPLPKRQTVELKSGGYHLMLMDLQQPLVKGTTVPLTLGFEDAQGTKSSLTLQVPVGAPAGAAEGATGHKH